MKVIWYCLQSIARRSGRVVLYCVLALSGVGHVAALPIITAVEPGDFYPGGRARITATNVSQPAHPRIIFTRQVAAGRTNWYRADGAILSTVGPDIELQVIVPNIPRSMYRIYYQDDSTAPAAYGDKEFLVRDRYWYERHPTIFGVVTLLIAYVAYLLIKRDRKSLAVWDLWCGADGRPSTSKFQLVVWSAVVFFVFSTIAAVYLINHQPFTTDSGCTLPQNIWIVLGLSGLTAIAAKGITSGQVANGTVAKPDPTASAPGGLVTSDEGGPDLMKTQLLTWTLVAVTVYVVQFLQQLARLKLSSSPGCEVPDIDTTLMVLMGISQGTYLGKKFVSSDTARIVSISQSRGTVGTAVTLNGIGFGSTQDGSVITIDGEPVFVPVTWADTQVTFNMPPTINGVAMTPGQHLLGVVVNGRASAGTINFGVTPNAQGITPLTLKIADLQRGPQQITIAGETFGSGGDVMIDNARVPPADVVQWTASSIVVALRANHPSGQPWSAGRAAVTVSVAGERSAAKELAIVP